MNKKTKTSSRINYLGLLTISFLSLTTAIGCAGDFSQFGDRQRKTAPQDASSVGVMTYNAEKKDVLHLIEQNQQIEFRVINEAYGVYEFHNVDLKEVRHALPSAQVEMNAYIDTFNTQDLRKTFENPSKKAVELLNAKLMEEEETEGEQGDEDSPTEEDDQRLNKCADDIAEPTALLEVKSPTVDLKTVSVDLGVTIKLSGANSAANPSHPSNLKSAFVVLPPNGSKQQDMVVFAAQEFEFQPDSYGLYTVVYAVQDDRDVCGLAAVDFVVSGNIPFAAEKEVDEDLVKAVDMSLFTHLSAVQAEDSWKISSGKDVKIAVIDSGVNYNHFALNSNIATFPDEIPENQLDDDGNGFVDDVVGYDFVNSDAYPFDDQGHGSHVAGLAASPLFGMAKEATIMPVKALGPRGGDMASIVGGILYAVENGAQILNMSFGNYGVAHPSLVEALNHAEAKGVLVTAASGNGDPVFGFGLSTDQIPNFPSALPNDNIIAVAASDSQNPLASYSNYGKNTVDIIAPGGMAPDDGLVSAFLENPQEIQFLPMAGTSMASPIVAGVVAQVWAMNPELSALEVKEILMTAGEEDSSLKEYVVSGRALNAHTVVKHYQKLLEDESDTPSGCGCFH